MPAGRPERPVLLMSGKASSRAATSAMSEPVEAVSASCPSKPLVPPGRPTISMSHLTTIPSVMSRPSLGMTTSVAILYSFE